MRGISVGEMLWLVHVGLGKGVRVIYVALISGLMAAPYATSALFSWLAPIFGYISFGFVMFWGVVLVLLGVSMARDTWDHGYRWGYLVVVIGLSLMAFRVWSLQAGW